MSAAARLWSTDDAPRRARPTLTWRVLAAGLPRPWRALFLYLWDWKESHPGKPIILSIDEMARDLKYSRRTIQFQLAGIERYGMLARAYNGGRAKRCIYFVGSEAAADLEAAFPAWQIACKRGRKLGVFGNLRWGKPKLEKESRKDAATCIQDGPHSLPSEETRQRSREAEAMPADGDWPLPLVWTEPPPNLPGGEAAESSTPAVATPELSAGPMPALAHHELVVSASQPPRTLPPLRVGKKRSKSVEARGAGASTVRARIWESHPGLFRAAYALVRAFRALKYRGTPFEYEDRQNDPLALHKVLTCALFAGGRREDEALRIGAWWMLKFYRDRKPFGSTPIDHHPLYLLARDAVRLEYGRPPNSWAIPTREQFEKALSDKLLQAERLAAARQLSIGARRTHQRPGVKTQAETMVIAQSIADMEPSGPRPGNEEK